ncbi:MAG TPA: hypothetical protein VK978_02565 [Candidatus Saccharimonadales bacterium]|nr:hypothetical protein [Candidatus Saccharimonadales bacterium]
MEIKTEQDLDAALRAHNEKKRRNLKRELKVQIVVFAVLTLIGVTLLFPERIGFEPQGVLRVTYRIAALFYTVWGLTGLFITIRRYRQKAWGIVTQLDKRLYVFQSIIGTVVVNLVIFTSPVEGYVKRGIPAIGELVVMLALFVLANWFFMRSYRRGYADLLATEKEAK